MITIPIWLLVLLIVLIILFALLFWSVKRRSRLHLKSDDTHSVKELIPSIAGVTEGMVVGGNRIELLQNGKAWDPLFEDLENANGTIHIETFLAKEGELTHRITEILSNKATQKVRVRLMLDASGGKNYGKEDVKRMREAGVEIKFYHPFNIRNIGRFNNRTHRKIAVIDGRIAYLGGHCFVDTWLGDAEDKKHFRDISVRIEGPVVGQVQSAFADNWIEETGHVFGGPDVFPYLEKRGEIEAHAVYVSPMGSPSSLKLVHYLAIKVAQKKLTLQNPYFLPDPDARDALVQAVKRGVEVRIMLPSAEASDSALVQHASHHHFGTLLKGGIRIFEYNRTLLHQKVFTVDGCWSFIGSTNFDDRSFEINQEVSLSIFDEGIARELEEIFQRDLEHATEMKLEKWQHRSLFHKLTDFSAFLINEQL